MGVFTYKAETTNGISPAKLLKAFILDAVNLIPKMAPQAIKSAEIIEGNGGPGTIKKITFGEVSQFNYVKHTIDEIDHFNFTYSHSLIKGDALTDIIEKTSYEMKLVASPDGATKAKASSSQGTGMQQSRPGHAVAKAKTTKARACSSQGQDKQQPRQGHAAAKAKASSSQGTGMQQPRPGHAAAKAKAAPHGQATTKAKASSSQGTGMQQPRPGHAAAKAKAAPHGQATTKAMGKQQPRPRGKQQPRQGHAAGKGEGTSKYHTKYHTKGVHEIKEEQIKAGKEKAARLFKAVEGYLLANPDAYN